MVVTNQQIFERLGELSAGQSHAAESRKAMHGRMDRQDVVLNETVNTLSKVQFAAEVTAGILSQFRDKMEKIDEKLSNEIEPALATAATFQQDAAPLIALLKNIRLAIWALVTVLGVGGATTIAFAAFFENLARSAIRAWLGV